MRHNLGRPLAALILAALPSSALAQAAATISDPPIPCSAFARDMGGGWTVTAPAMLDFNGMLVSFTVGTRLSPGSSPHGVAIPVILDRQCGNRPTHPFRP